MCNYELKKIMYLVMSEASVELRQRILEARPR